MDTAGEAEESKCKTLEEARKGRHLSVLQQCDMVETTASIRLMYKICGFFKLESFGTSFPFRLIPHQLKSKTNTLIRLTQNGGPFLVSQTEKQDSKTKLIIDSLPKRRSEGIRTLNARENQAII